MEKMENMEKNLVTFWELWDERVAFPCNADFSLDTDTFPCEIDDFPCKHSGKDAKLWRRLREWRQWGSLDISGHLLLQTL
jgi:hypothetical protein